MTGRWPSARTWRRIAIASAGTLLFLVLALRLLAMTPMARAVVEARVEAMTIRGQSLQLDGFEGDVLGRMSVRSLTVSDTSGVWAKAKNVELAWGPFGLLSGHLRLHEVTSESLMVSRRPELGPSGSGGSSLNRYTIKSLSVPTLLLSQGVAGPAQTYALSGRLEAGGRSGEVALDLSPLAGRGDLAKIELAWGGAVPLIGHVDIQGPPGGLIAALLEAPDTAGVSAKLEASGTVQDWQLVANSAVGGTAILDLEAQYQNTEYSAAGTIGFDQLASLKALRDRLGDRMAFRTALDAQRRLSGDITAGTISATFSGRLQSPATGIVIEGLDLAASDVMASVLTGQEELGLPQFTALGTLSLSSSQQSFEGEITAPDVNYRNYQLADARAVGVFARDDASLSIDAELFATAMTGLPDRVQRALSGEVRFDLDANLSRKTRDLQIAQFALDAGDTRAAGSGQITLGGGFDLSGDLDLARLDPVSRFAGRWALSGETVSTAQLSLDGNLAFTDAAGPLQQISADNARLKMTLTRGQDDLILQSASLRTADLQAMASGTLSQGQLAITGDVTASALALARFETHDLQAQFGLSGPVSAPGLTFIASAQDLTAAGRTFERPELSGQIKLADSSTFSATAKAQYLAAPLTLDVNGARQSGNLQLTQIKADWADLHAAGQALLKPAEPKASEIDLVVTGSPPTLGEIEAQIAYRNETLDSAVTLGETTFGPLKIARSQITLDGTWPNFSGALDYDAEVPMLGEARAISGTHDIAANADTRLITVEGAFKLSGQVFNLTAPLQINLDTGSQIDGQISAFGGQIDLALHPLADTPSRIRLSNLAMSAFGPLINRPALRGTLNGSAELALIDGQLNGLASATIAGLARGAPDAPAADMRLSAAIAADRLTAELRAEDTEQALRFTANLSAPLTHQGQLFSVRPAAGAAIPMSLQGEGPIAPLWALAAPTDLRLEGDLSVDINNGSGATRRFQGPLTFHDGVFEDGITGLHLTDIAVTAALRPDGIQVEAADARGTRSGTVQASGLYGFDGNGTVALSLNRLNAFKRSDVSVTVSGQAEIDRRNRRTQVSGALEIDQARINLEKLPGAGYTTLDVVFTDQLDAAASTSPEREAIVLDLDLSADRRIFVVGSGVDTEWGLAARVSGSPGRPSIIGRANLVRGEADLLSRRFRFSEGRVQFVGAPMESEITLRADRTSDDITSSITLSGTMTDPEISLSADPSLPDDEILARVLFGRSPSELSPLQAAQLAGAAAQLAGGDALNLVGQLQAATGFDRLDFGLDDDGQAMLSTGKYLADDIYLEIESGVTGAPGVALQWTPLENVAIDAEIDPELGPKVAIQWKRDFERLPGEADPD